MEAFARWQDETSGTVAQFPGFIKQTVMPPSPPAQADWVILQRFASTATAGNGILISIIYVNTQLIELLPTAVLLSDGVTSCTRDARGFSLGFVDSAFWYSCFNIPTGITGVTIAQSSTSWTQYTILEVSGPTSFDHQSAGHAISNGTTWSTAAVTPTAGMQALIVGFCNGNNGFAMAASGIYTTYAANNVGIAVADAVAIVPTTSGSYTPTGTNAASQGASGCLAASYK